ncbi:hypothetical protein A5636_13550 [Mycobacterium asiaticum]|uniref:Uncharacterized protein n=2 Tax=Mycobacterium asiaticum TaxID=1790 RepID=A0A1A3MP98_MYCAS|nr:hypothetical protein A5636_13550 [Mycobacterium asiaticum]
MLSHVGVEVANHGRTLLALQRSCHEDADGAQLGWVGSSAVELGGLLDHWAGASVGHLNRIEEHAAGMHTAAVGSVELERRNASRLR